MHLRFGRLQSGPIQPPEMERKSSTPHQRFWQLCLLYGILTATWQTRCQLLLRGSFLRNPEKICSSHARMKSFCTLSSLLLILETCIILVQLPHFFLLTEKPTFSPTKFQEKGE